MKLFIVSAMLLTTTNLMAKPSGYFKALAKDSPYSQVEYKWTTQKEAQSLKAQFEKSKRTPSSQLKADEGMMSDEFKATRDKFLSLKTADELESFWLI